MTFYQTSLKTASREFASIEHALMKALDCRGVYNILPAIIYDYHLP